MKSVCLKSWRTLKPTHYEQALLYAASGLVLMSCMSQIAVPIKGINPSCALAQPTDGFIKGIGTSSSPYLICTSEQFALLATKTVLLQSSFELGHNIDLSQMSEAIGDYDYVGGSGTPFTGELNGAGYLLSGFTLDEAIDGRPSGLFRFVQGAKFKNLKLRGFDVSGRAESGALIGRAEGVQLTSIDATYTVNATQSSRGYSGGLIGSATATSSAPLSVDAIVLSGTVRGIQRVGGLIGYLLVDSGTAGVSNAQLQSVTVRDPESVTAAQDGYAGVIGYLTQQGAGSATSFSDITISNVDVRGTSRVGGMLGWVYVTNGTFNVTRVSVTGSTAVRTGTSFEMAGSALGLPMLYVENATSSAVVDGLAVQGTVMAGDGGGGIGALWRPLLGARITLRNCSFDGTLGYEPTTRTSNTYGALVSHTYLTGASTLLYEKCRVNANVTAPGSWNGVAFSTVSVNDTANATFRDLQIVGSLTTTGRTYSITNNGMFSGNWNGGVFGAVGINGGSVTIARISSVTDMYNNSVLANRNDIGGFMGYTSPAGGTLTISDSYARGSISSLGTLTSVGQLFGSINQSGTGSATFSRNYADVQFNPGGSWTQAGGYTGTTTTTSTTHVNSYYNSDRFATASASGAVTGVTALTSAQLLQQSNFSGWNFSTIWQMVSGVSLPTLR